MGGVAEVVSQNIFFFKGVFMGGGGGGGGGADAHAQILSKLKKRGGVG